MQTSGLTPARGKENDSRLYLLPVGPPFVRQSTVSDHNDRPPPVPELSLSRLTF